MSCVQFYPATMSESAIFSRKRCEKAAGVHRSSQCPEDFPHFLRGDCFKVSAGAARFKDAEIACMPFPVNSPYDSRLAWPSDRMTLDRLARLVAAEHGTPEFWVGLDWRAGGAKWQTSFGEERVNKTDPMWETGRAAAGGNERCASTAGLDGGLIKAGNCGEEKPFVCMTAPLYRRPDNRCPRDHHSYKGDCFRKSAAKRPFEEAVADCAGTGGVMYAPKTAAEHEFLANYAKAFINSNVYIGVSKGTRSGQYDDNQDPEERSLTEVESGEAWSFTDGTPYNSTTGYRYHIPQGNRLNGPCLYLKTNTGYAGREIKCGNRYHYVCRWTPHDCPAGYERLGPLSDGRTCHGVPPRPVRFGGGMCRGDPGDDDLRRPALPDSPSLALALRRQMSGDLAFVGYALPRQWTNGSWVSGATGFDPEIPMITPKGAR